MGYEFATWLKEHGFSQGGKGFFIASDDPKKGSVYSPTLDEIIKACGERFSSVERISDTNGIAFWRTETNDNKFFNGKTAEESVGWLYLHINKKEDEKEIYN